MIFYLSRAGHQYTLRKALDGAAIEGGAALAPLRSYRLLSYERLFKLRKLPIGSYIFSDIERLDPAATERAAAIWEALAGSGKGLILLNHPIRSMRRFELLRRLHRDGVNDYTVRRLTDADVPGRLPVFIRDENEHRGSLTPLLHTRDAFDRAVERLVAAGMNRDDKLVVEFVDTTDADGLHHRYSAQIIGRRIVPACLYFSRDWMIKNRDPGCTGPALVERERAYIADNPHEALLRPIFDLARIEFGRIDYAVVGGRLRIFEINTNPSGVRAADLADAVAALDCAADATIPAPVRARVQEPWRERRDTNYWSDRIIHYIHRAGRALRISKERRTGP